MYLPEIQNGTKFTVIFEDGNELQAEYVGNINHSHYNIISPEISENIEQYKNAAVTIHFDMRDKKYVFTSQVVGLKSKQDSNVNLKVTSFFKEAPLRTSIRINISLKVTIFTLMGSIESPFPGQFLCEALSDDISKNGIRILSDFNLDAPLDSVFMLKISLPLGPSYVFPNKLAPGSSYVFPAKLVRSLRSTFGQAYGYDYGFTFLSNEQSQQEKLILDLLQITTNTNR